MPKLPDMLRKATGYRTWSEAEIERFETLHPIGTKARLAFALLLYTGQRRGDVVKLGRQHIHGDVLTVDQGKTEGGEEAHLEIPVHPKLREIIEATPTVGVKTFLVTHFGKPYTAPGFGNWFRELCDTVGCPDVSAHGLRKATARRLAEIGCTAHQIAAITGPLHSARCNATPKPPIASVWHAKPWPSWSRKDGEQNC